MWRNNIHDKIRQLTSEEMQAAWTASVNKDDSFCINGKQYTVTVHTEKTFRLKDFSGKNYTFKRYNNQFMAEGKEADLSRNVEGELVIDLINQYNHLHEPSDIFKMTAQTLNNAN